MKKNNYTSPLVSMTALSVENGFAQSGPKTQWWRDEINDVNIGWSYSADDQTWE